MEVARGKTVAGALKKIGVTKQTYYRWKKKFGGLRIDQAKRREAVEHVRGVFGCNRVSERRACREIGQSRSTQRRTRRVPTDEPRLVKRIEWLPCEYGRYGCRRITALLRRDDWRVNHKRVKRIWRAEGLKVLKTQP